MHGSIKSFALRHKLCQEIGPRCNSIEPLQPHPIPGQPWSKLGSDNFYLEWEISIKHICCKYGIRTHFKGNRTLKQIFVKPKGKDPEDKKSGVIFCYQCSAIDHAEEYIGETARTLGERYPEHLRGPFLYRCTTN